MHRRGDVEKTNVGLWHWVKFDCHKIPTPLEAAICLLTLPLVSCCNDFVFSNLYLFWKWNFLGLGMKIRNEYKGNLKENRKWQKEVKSVGKLLLAHFWSYSSSIPQIWHNFSFGTLFFRCTYLSTHIIRTLPIKHKFYSEIRLTLQTKTNKKTTC